MRTVVGKLLPGRALHALVDVGVIHHVRHPLAALFAVIELGFSLTLPRLCQFLFRRVGANGLGGTDMGTGQVAEKLIAIPSGVGNDLVPRGGVSFH